MPLLRLEHGQGRRDRGRATHARADRERAPQVLRHAPRPPDEFDGREGDEHAERAADEHCRTDGGQRAHVEPHPEQHDAKAQEDLGGEARAGGHPSDTAPTRQAPESAGEEREHERAEEFEAGDPGELVGEEREQYDEGEAGQERSKAPGGGGSGHRRSV